MKFASTKTTFFIILYIWLAPNSAVGQCIEKSIENTKYAFSGVTKTDERNEILARYNLFVSFYCKSQFPNAAEMLLPAVISAHKKADGSDFSKQDWVDSKLERYNDKSIKFVSFRPESSVELLNNDGTAWGWQIEGCLVELVSGKVKKNKGRLDVFKRIDGIYFSDIGPIYLSMAGDTEKC